MAAGVLGFAGLGVAIFALISVIVSVALEYWIYQSAEAGGITAKRYSGLWKQCDQVDSVKDCQTYDGDLVSTDLKVVRAMVLLALILDVVAIVCGALKLFVMKDKKVIGYAAAGVLLVSGLFLIVGFAVYVDKIFNPYVKLFEGSDNKPSLHAGFAFCIIAWIAAWVAAALFGAATVSDKDAM